MKIKILTLIIVICMCSTTLVMASPTVSFTYLSVENKTVLTPVINSEVDEYRWTIYNKNNSYNSNTEWIPRENAREHVSILHNGKYFVTIEGRNNTSGDTRSFTNEIKVRVRNETIEEEEPAQGVLEDIGSRIVNMFPEPIRSFLIQIGAFGIAVIIFGFLFVLAIVTRKKKVKEYVELKKYEP